MTIEKSNPNDREKGWFKGEDRLQVAGGVNMIKRLNERVSETMKELLRDYRIDTSKMRDITAEQKEWRIESDGQHLYIGRETEMSDPQQLAVLETFVYNDRIKDIEWAAGIHIFSNGSASTLTPELIIHFEKNSLDLKAASQYLNAYLTSGIDPDEVLDYIDAQADQIRENPRRFEPQPERATEYLAACVETMRQLFTKTRFTVESFKAIYPKLEKLANRLSVFEPELSEGDRMYMRDDEDDPMTDEQIDELLEGAKDHHRAYCERLSVYRELAYSIMQQ
ncbi:hypothetical protein KY343_05005 [Candidatus Woesearchaeota archaeon]|nr:hypothetical protein [Candidatus Woesearchaeota archaeon]